MRYISRGYTNADIARELKVTPETIYNYRKQWKQKIQDEKAENPQLLQNILDNTFQMLEEYDQIRTEAWKAFQATESIQLKNQIIGQLTKLQQDRAKLMGLFGVKQEYFYEVNKIKVIQEKLLEFMRKELCAEDRAKLQTLLTTELAPYMVSHGSQQPLIIEAKETA